MVLSNLYRILTDIRVVPYYRRFTNEKWEMTEESAAWIDYEYKDCEYRCTGPTHPYLEVRTNNLIVVLEDYI